MANPTEKDKELILQTYFQTSDEVMYWNQTGNEKVFEVSKQLLGAAVIAIPLTGTIVTSVGRGHLFTGAGYLLAFALLLILASIVSGIKQLNIASEFFNGYMQYNANRARALLMSRNLTYDAALTKADEANSYKLPESKADSGYLTVQKWSLGAGLLIIIGIIVTLAFLQ